MIRNDDRLEPKLQYSQKAALMLAARLPGYVYDLHRRRNDYTCAYCELAWPCRGGQWQIEDVRRFALEWWYEPWSLETGLPVRTRADVKSSDVKTVTDDAA